MDTIAARATLDSSATVGDEASAGLSPSATRKQLLLDKRRRIAFYRFGLGPKSKGWELKDPKQTLLDELKIKGVTRIALTAKLPSYGQACRAGEVGSYVSNGITYNSYDVYRNELDARYQKHMAARIGFVERLVLFWANHFSMTINKTTQIEGTIGHFERTVIRPYVLGKFPDMLVKAISHPAMIIYLDNQVSVGPNSPYALNSQSTYKSVNVNLAREIMELHTVGSGGGYTEADVRALAYIISGWSYASQSECGAQANGARPGLEGQFLYKPNWHQPGAIKHMGTTFAAAGKWQAVKALKALALKPATAEHLAFKMVRHFLTDSPAPEMVEPIARAYLKSGGSLKAMAKALVNLPAAWTLPFTKVRTPYESVVAQYRAMGRYHSKWVKKPDNSDGSTYVYTNENLKFLQQMPWQCLDPDGWPDESANWLSPDGLRVRLQAFKNAADHFTPSSLDTKAEVVARAKRVLGLNLSAATIKAINAAPSAKAAVAILFVSPEFQRR